MECEARRSGIKSSSWMVMVIRKVQFMYVGRSSEYSFTCFYDGSNFDHLLLLLMSLLWHAACTCTTLHFKLLETAISYIMITYGISYS